jgi:response regulator RpfG family c-di-GMP phosphodiesterase
MYCTRLARGLGLAESEVRTIEQGALLHDIGKIGISDELLAKKGNLTESEFALVRGHSEIGFKILAGIKFLRGAAEIVLQHQEWYDGSGYPSGLKGEEIHIGARIFALASALDDAAAGGSRQTPSNIESIRREICRMAGTRLDPLVVEAFLKVPVEEWETIRENASATWRSGFSQLLAR